MIHVHLLVDFQMKRTQLNINIDPNLLKEIKASARKSGKSLVDYVNDFFRSHLHHDLDSDLEMRLSNLEKRLKTQLLSERIQLTLDTDI